MFEIRSLLYLTLMGKSYVGLVNPASFLGKEFDRKVFKDLIRYLVEHEGVVVSVVDLILFG